jgi:Zn-dependent protease
MMRASFRLGKLAGVEIGVNASLLLVAALITLQMAQGFFPSRLPDLNPAWYWIGGAVTALIFFVSIVWHEMAHALTARYYNIPVRHIILNFIGGAAFIEEDPRSPSSAFWIALAGPLSSAVLGVFFIVLARSLPPDNLVTLMCFWLGQINLMLAAFNMIPGLPLDGGRVFLAAIWFFTRNQLLATKIAVRTGQILASFFFIGALASFIVAGDIFGGMWLALIGWFLWNYGKSYLMLVRRRWAMANTPIRQLLGRSIRLSPDWSLSYALDVMSMNGVMRAAPVVQDDQTIGFFAIDSLRRVPGSTGVTLRVGNLMKTLTDVPSVSPDTDVFDTLRKMELAESDYVLVRNELGILGVLARYDLLRFVEGRMRPRVAA